jgi:hypothetical protein
LPHTARGQWLSRCVAKQITLVLNFEIF